MRHLIQWSSSYFYHRFKSNHMNPSIDSLFIPSSTSPTPILSSDPISIISYATSHFSNLWSNSHSLPLPSPLSVYLPHPLLLNLTNPSLQLNFFLQLIQNKITDGLPYKFYKSFLLPTSRILIPIFHMIASGSPPPSSWLNGYTILLHKKNTDPHYVSNLWTRWAIPEGSSQHRFMIGLRVTNAINHIHNSLLRYNLQR